MHPPIPPQQMLARALAAHQSGNIGQAELLYKLVLQADKSQFDALHMLAILEGQRGNFAVALRHIRQALRVRPKSVDALLNLGRIQSELGDDAAAMATYGQVLALDQKSALAHLNFAVALSRLRRAEEALGHCDAAVALAPAVADGWTCRANVLLDLKRLAEALDSYRRALALQPKLAEAHLGCATTLRQLNRYDEALDAYDKALALKPELGDAWYGRGRILFALKRYEEAIAAYGKAAALNADYAQGARLSTKMQICDWSDFETERVALIAAIMQRGAKADPFRMLAISASPAEQLRCAEIFMADHCPPSERPLYRGERYQHDRIRIAYVSSDFRNHPLAYLTAGMFEAHDRSRFETIAVSISPPADDAMQQRLRGAFQHFFDVDLQIDQEIAAMIRSREIDIVVDLNGYTTHSRTPILAFRPAPIQVNFLGYAGSMAAPYIDYLIADRTVIPDEHAAFYAEKVVRLPDSYYVNDRARVIADHTPSRRDLALPETGFVFCSFNNLYKIQPLVFDVWMRLLRDVDNSVLWLFAENDSAVNNLRAEATRRGVAPERLIFAPRVAAADYLARLRQADLVLDTLPYNAHTTACDALWAGVPVLTCLGSTFAGRVAASILKAVDLSELITTSLADYESLALKIAREPALAIALKQKLAHNRDACALFDTARFTRHMETAYSIMWQRHQAGGLPESFAVPPI